MRLKNLSDDAGATKEESKTETGAAKRSRSSLDYKAKRQLSGEKPLTTKPGKRKNPDQQQQQQSEEERQQQPRRRITQSRARGSSGPPPRKWDLADLEGMNEDQLLQALYEDPELAAAAAKAAEKMASTQPTGAKNARHKGPGGGTKQIGDPPAHLRELMDGGVPVMQWVILLILLGAGLYQLRSVLMGPEKKTSTVASPVKGKKGKKKVETKAKKLETPLEAAKDPVEETVRMLESEEVKSPPEKKAALLTKKQPLAKKTKKKKPVVTPKKEEKKPGDLSTKKSSDEMENDKPAASTSANIPIHSDPEAGDDGGWHTVSKTRAAQIQSTASPAQEEDAMPGLTEAPPDKRPKVVAEKPAAVEANNSAEKNSLNGSSGIISELKDIPETHATPSGVDNNPIHDTQQAAGEIAQPKSGKKKKKSKNKAENNATNMKMKSENNNGANELNKEKSTSTADDEAIALMLQKEEEARLASAETDAEAKEEVWEEVTAKKKKTNNKAIAA